MNECPYMKRISFPVFILSGIVCFCGCARINMNVKSYSDPARNLLEYKRFSVVERKSDPGHLLLEKELLFLSRQILTDKGYVYDEENPDFLVVMDFYCGPFKYYVPPTTLYFPHYVQGESKTFSGFIDDSYFFGTQQSEGGLEYLPYSTGGYTATAYYRNITLYFVDVERLLDSEKVEVIWIGDAESSGKTSDLLFVAPYMLKELMGEFPRRTRKSTNRTVYINH